MNLESEDRKEASDMKGKKKTRKKMEMIIKEIIRKRKETITEEIRDTLQTSSIVPPLRDRKDPW